MTSTPVVSEPLTRYTSSVIVQVEGELLMFAGTSDGRLLKVKIDVQPATVDDVNYDSCCSISLSITASTILYCTMQSISLIQASYHYNGHQVVTMCMD